MLKQAKLTQLQELLEVTSTAVVIVKNTPNLDQLATAASLALSLKLAGKEVHFLSPQTPNAEKNGEGSSSIQTRNGGEFDLKKNLPQGSWEAHHEDDNLSKIAGLEMISTKMGNQNLVVSFEYSETAVDKVSYHIGEESGKFFLTIKPQKGHKPLDSSQVEFAYTGMEADIVFLVGVHDLEALEHLYFGHEKFYRETPLVTLHSFEPEIGLIKFDLSHGLCFAEAVVEMMEALQLPLNSDIATNLLLSIEAKTAGLTSLNMTAESFETVAKLLRAGARRQKVVDLSSSELLSEKKSKTPQTDSQKTKKKKQKKSVQKSQEKTSHQSMGGLDHKPSGFRS